MFRLALSAFRLASAFCASACLHRTVSLRSGRGGGGGPEGAKCSRQWSLRGTYSGESSLDAPGKVEPAAWAGGAGRATLATAAARSPTACRRPPRVCAALAWTRIQPWSWWRGLLPVLLPPRTPHSSSVFVAQPGHGQIVNWIASAAVGVQGGGARWGTACSKRWGSFCTSLSSKQTKPARIPAPRARHRGPVRDSASQRSGGSLERGTPRGGVERSLSTASNNPRDLEKQITRTTRTRGAGDPSSSVFPWNTGSQWSVSGG